MARSNYGFEKRQRELSKERKKEEKRQRKLDRKNADQVSDGATRDRLGQDAPRGSGTQAVRPSTVKTSSRTQASTTSPANPQ
jgi:hypothetical protein